MQYSIPSSSSSSSGCRGSGAPIICYPCQARENNCEASAPCFRIKGERLVAGQWWAGSTPSVMQLLVMRAYYDLARSGRWTISIIRGRLVRTCGWFNMDRWTVGRCCIWSIMMTDLNSVFRTVRGPGQYRDKGVLLSMPNFEIFNGGPE